MEEVGRLSFPNGRTGAPVIVGDLVIVRGITANWGGDGPARDRFYAYQKKSGDLVWASTPGVQPQDSSFSTGVIEMRDGAPVMYATTGCGHFVAMNALTGKPLWRFLTAKGGVNASPILVNGKLISAHDKENIDTTTTGGLECIRLPEGALPPGPPRRGACLTLLKPAPRFMPMAWFSRWPLPVCSTRWTRKREPSSGSRNWDPATCTLPRFM
jgi:hypothetical protein